MSWLDEYYANASNPYGVENPYGSSSPGPINPLSEIAGSFGSGLAGIAASGLRAMNTWSPIGITNNLMRNVFPNAPNPLDVGDAAVEGLYGVRDRLASDVDFDDNPLTASATYVAGALPQLGLTMLNPAAGVSSAAGSGFYDSYDEGRDRGLSEAEAIGKGTLSAASSALLEFLGGKALSRGMGLAADSATTAQRRIGSSLLDRLRAPKPNLTAGTMSVGGEGLTEMADEGVQVGLESLTGREHTADELVERLRASLIGGVGSGGLVHGASRLGSSRDVLHGLMSEHEVEIQEVKGNTDSAHRENVEHHKRLAAPLQSFLTKNYQPEQMDQVFGEIANYVEGKESAVNEIEPLRNLVEPVRQQVMDYHQALVDRGHLGGHFPVGKYFMREFLMHNDPQFVEKLKKERPEVWDAGIDLLVTENKKKAKKAGGVEEDVDHQWSRDEEAGLQAQAHDELTQIVTHLGADDFQNFSSGSSDLLGLPNTANSRQRKRIVKTIREAMGEDRSLGALFKMMDKQSLYLTRSEMYNTLRQSAMTDMENQGQAPLHRDASQGDVAVWNPGNFKPLPQAYTRKMTSEEHQAVSDAFRRGDDFDSILDSTPLTADDKAAIQSTIARKTNATIDEFGTPPNGSQLREIQEGVLRAKGREQDQDLRVNKDYWNYLDQHTRRVQVDQSKNPVWDAIRMGNIGHKKWMTVYNVLPTGMRNMGSSFWGIHTQGHLFDQDVGELLKGIRNLDLERAIRSNSAGSVTLDVLREGGSRLKNKLFKQGADSYLQEARNLFAPYNVEAGNIVTTELGELGDQSFFGKFSSRAKFNDSLKRGSTFADTAKSALAKTDNFFQSFYAAGDNIAKVALAKAEAKRLSQALGKRETDPEVLKEAANTVKNVTQNYGRLPEVLKGISKASGGTLGTFPLFMYASAANQTNSIRQAIHEIQDPTGARRAIGFQRLAGQSVGAAGIGGVVNFLMHGLPAVFGGDDEEKSLLKRLQSVMPDMVHSGQSHQELIPLKRLPDGRIAYTNALGLDYYAGTRSAAFRALREARLGGSLGDVLLGVGMNYALPVFGPSPGSEAILDALNGTEAETGKKIYFQSDTGPQKLVKGIKHVGKEMFLAGGNMRSALKLLESGTRGDDERLALETLGALGLRISIADPRDSLKWTGLAYYMQDAKQEMGSVFRSPESSSEDLVKVFQNNMQRAQKGLDMYEREVEGSRLLGLSTEEIVAASKRRGAYGPESKVIDAFHLYGKDVAMRYWQQKETGRLFKNRMESLKENLVLEMGKEKDPQKQKEIRERYVSLMTETKRLFDSMGGVQ